MEHSKRSRLSIILGSVSLVILVGSQYINDILNLYIGNDRGFFTPIIALASILGIIAIAATRRIKVNKTVTSLVAILVIAFVMTNILQRGKSTLSFVDFVGMCLLPIVLGAFLIIDYKLVFKGCMLLLVIAIPVYQRLFLKANIGINYDAVSMSTSYDILPVTIAGLVHFLYFRKDSKIIDKVLYIVSAIFSLSLIRMSYRGALLALVVTLILAFYFQKRRDSLRNQLLFLTIAIVVIILLINYQAVLMGLSALLNKFGIRIAFIDKSVYLLANETTAHGRLDIYRKAIEGFWSSPMWGNGMATFQYYTNYPFPHNFILEFLFDGGLLLSVPLIGIFITAIRRLLRRTWDAPRYRFAFVLMIGSIAITRGLISAESWRIVLLWLFLGLALNNTEMEDISYGQEQSQEELSL